MHGRGVGCEGAITVGVWAVGMRNCSAGRTRLRPTRSDNSRWVAHRPAAHRGHKATLQQNATRDTASDTTTQHRHTRTSAHTRTHTHTHTSRTYAPRTCSLGPRQRVHSAGSHALPERIGGLGCTHDSPHLRSLLSSLNPHSVSLFWSLSLSHSISLYPSISSSFFPLSLPLSLSLSLSLSVFSVDSTANRCCATLCAAARRGGGTCLETDRGCEFIAGRWCRRG